MAFDSPTGSSSTAATAGLDSAPMRLPPGLGEPNAGNGSASQAANGSTALSEREALLNDVRREAMAAVEAKVAEKMKELMDKGKAMMKKLETDSQAKNAVLLAELAQYKAKQETLQLEHDHLRTTLAGIVTHLNLIGNALGSAPGTKAAGSSTNGTATSCGDANSSSAASVSGSLQDSPSEFSSSSYAAGPFPPLPELPPFPFPPPATSTPLPSAATPLSLAEALGSDPVSTPVPVSLLGSLSAPSPSVPKMFSFTLRKADGTDLGLNVSHHEEDKVLRVESVRAEGAVEAWNRQCIGSTASEKAVMPGDRIVSVNSVARDPKAMLEECRDKQLLKLTVVRGPEVEALKPTTLRADASEFVPGGSLETKTEEPAEEEAEKDTSAEKTTDC